MQGLQKHLKRAFIRRLKNALMLKSKAKRNLNILLPFNGAHALDGLPFDRIAYFKLVDWTSRKMQDGKASVAHSEPELLERLRLMNTTGWP